MSMADYRNNYTLGRGELYFAPYKPGTREPMGELYFGNTPEFSATIETETLDHYNSDRGINEKDASVPLQTNRTATFVTDNISPENIAFFFFGKVENFADAGQTVSDELIRDVQLGRSYQLGISPSNPVGVRALDMNGANAPVVTDESGTTTYAAGTDYRIDGDHGRVYILPSSSITEGSTLKVSYTTLPSTRKRIISGSTPIEGALRYITANPAGDQYDWYMPYVRISPNGDYALKGDEWQQIPFQVEILKKEGLEAIYIDGQPLVA